MEVDAAIHDDGVEVMNRPPGLCGNQIYGAFVLNSCVDLHAIDATPARWRGGVGSSPLGGTSAATSSPRNDLVKNYRVRPTLVDFHTAFDDTADKRTSRLPPSPGAGRR